MANNPLYRETEYDYNQATAAIDASSLDAGQKAEQHKSTFNDLVSKNQNLMDAMHIPSDMQHPLPHDFVESSKASWGLDKDPAALISHADTLQQGFKEYLARGQDTPIHQEVTRIVANMKGGTIPGGIFGGNSRITEQDRGDWVLANQSNRNFSDLKLHTEGGSDFALKKDIQDKIGDTLKTISRQEGGQSRGVAMVDAATNYIKFLAQKSGDLTFENRDAYVKKAAAMVNAANPTVTGTNWSINPKDVPASPGEMDKIANHAIEEVQLKIHDRFGKDRGQAMIGSNSLSVMSTPTGHIVVVDAYGNKLAETKYNDRMGHYVDHVNKQKADKEKVENTPEQSEQDQKETIDDDIKETNKMRKAGERQAKKNKVLFDEAKTKRDAKK